MYVFVTKNCLTIFLELIKLVYHQSGMLKCYIWSILTLAMMHTFHLIFLKFVFSRSTLLRSVGLLYMEHLSVDKFLIQSPNYNWLWQVMWHKNYWWHHSMLSTRPNDSTSLVTSVKVSWLRPRAPEVSFENYAWLTHLPQL